ncbi:MAG: hypothetical protein Q8O19_01500 [Rectinemataceae bacterium]|nr:hypothetical protein [Rectinemataceae bacterium]
MKENFVMTDNDAVNCRRNSFALGKKLLLVGALGLFLLTNGCVSLSKEFYRHGMTWDPIQANRLIEASVRIESECKFTDDLHSFWKSLLNTDENIVNYQQACCSAIVDDMIGSHIFRRVVSPGDPNYDLLIKLVSINSKVSEKISLSVVNPKKQDVIASYDGTATLSASASVLWNAAVKRILADIRKQMISDFLEGKGIGTYLSIRYQASPSTLPTALPLPTESAEPF